MKSNVLKLTLLASIVTFAFACKNENKVEAGETEEILKTTAEVTTFNVDSENSKLDWAASKITATHTGFLKLSKGYLSIDEENSIAEGEFVIDMSTITVTDLEGTGKENLEAHLKGTVEGKEVDFFNINKYPTASFQVTGVETADGKTWLSGNLTIKEITKNIKFPINLSLEDNKVNLQSEEFTINRTDWEVNYGSKTIFQEIGDKVIYDDIKIVIQLEAIKS